MDYMEVVLAESDFNRTLQTPDSMFSIISEQSDSSSRVQGEVNPAYEEQDEAGQPQMPAIEDLDEAVPPAENRLARTESQATASSEPPPYTENSQTESSCTRRRRQSCSRCSRSCVCKLLVSWGVILALSIGLALTLRLTVFHKYSFNSSPTDVRKLDKFSTTYFCSTIEIRSTSEFNAFTFSYPPTIDDTNLAPFKMSAKVGIAPGNYQFWYYYLLKGSVMSVSICITEGNEQLNLYLFKTADNFKTFQKGCIEGSCPSWTSQVINKTNCMKKHTMNLSITDSNDYYIVVSGRNTIQAVPAAVNINISRATYSSDTIGDSLCLSQTKCIVSGALSPYGILYTTNDYSTYNAFTQVECSPDSETYVFLFMVIPGMIAFVISISILLRARDTRNQDDSSTQTASNSSRRSRTRFCGGPPTYEELFNSDGSGGHRRGSSGRPRELPPPYPGEEEAGSPGDPGTNAAGIGDENTGHESLSDETVNGGD